LNQSSKHLRDLVKYEAKREINRQNARLRWEKINATASDRIKTDANHAVSGSVSDSVPVPVPDSDSVKEDNTISAKKAEKAKNNFDFIDQIIQIFVEEHGSYEIINKGKEREMAGKIAKIYNKKYPEAKTEDVLKALRDYFRMCVNINDPWLKNNMSLSIIISKFNEINKFLKNGTNKKPGGATNEQLKKLYSARYGATTAQQ
jgi:hypothetical protein